MNRVARNARRDNPGAVSDEYIRIFKTLWTTSPASFKGEFYEFQEIRCLPQPIQKPHPPVWIGGHSRAALRRVARLGDGWHPVGANPAVPLQAADLCAGVVRMGLNVQSGHPFHAKARMDARLSLALSPFSTEFDRAKLQEFRPQIMQALTDVARAEAIAKKLAEDADVQ